MKRIMNKLKDWLNESNRYKHLLGGAAIGMMACGTWPAIYAGAVGGACLELKDKLYGNRWDLVDLGCTMVGAFLGRLVVLGFKALIGLL